MQAVARLLYKTGEFGALMRAYVFDRKIVTTLTTRNLIDVTHTLLYNPMAVVYCLCWKAALA